MTATDPQVARSERDRPTATRSGARRSTRRDDRRRTAARLVGGTAVVWLLLALASVAWWPVYRDGAMVTAGVTAVVAGTTVALLGAALRLPAVAVGAATVAAFALTGVPAAVPSQAAGLVPTGPGLVDLFAGVALDWKRLVTISLPVGSYESLLVPYFATLLVATVTAVTVATRASRPETASIPALVVFVAGVVVGPTRLDVSVVTAVALGGVALVWALTVRHVRRAVAVATTVGGRVPAWRSVLRPALVGTGTIVAAAVVATGLGVVAPPSVGRTVARSDVVKPFDPRDYVSPLSGFRAYEESEAADTAQLTVTGLPQGGFVRIATLDSYDGVVYRVGGEDGSSASGTFERVPTSVDVRGVDGRAVDVGVTVDAYRGVWLPTVGALESVAFRGTDAQRERGAFFYNRSTSTGAVVGGIDEGSRYELDALLPDQPSDEELAAARPGTATVPTARSVPDAVRERVDATTADAGTDGQKLVAAIRSLQTTGYVSHGVGDDRASRSGHGADRIQELLTAPVMIGDQEQYAVAAALMARQLGFPARVVMGFTAGGDSGTATGGAGADGTTTFRGSDVTARIEVDTAQWGWVMINPNPVVREIPDEQDQTPQPVTRPETVVPPPPAQQQDQDQQTPPQSDRDTPPVQPLWLQILLAALPWVLATLGFVALVLLPFGVIVLLKRLRRRRRRRAPTPRARIVGAWDEYRDALVDRGHDVARAATRREAVVGAPGEGGTGLAALADRSVFGPDDADPGAADRMWSAADDAIRTLRTGRTRRQRWRAAVSLRSLRVGEAVRSRVPGRVGSGPGRATGVGAAGRERRGVRDYDGPEAGERRGRPSEDRGEP